MSSITSLFCVVFHLFQCVCFCFLNSIHVFWSIKYVMTSPALVNAFFFFLFCVFRTLLVLLCWWLFPFSLCRSLSSSLFANIRTFPLKIGCCLTTIFSSLPAIFSRQIGMLSSRVITTSSCTISAFVRWHKFVPFLVENILKYKTFQKCRTLIYFSMVKKMLFIHVTSLVF